MTCCKFFIALFVCLLLVSRVCADALEDGFKNPPNSARVQTWWHWMNGNVSREGITKDLEAMQHDGIGGFTAFSVTDGIPPGPVGYMSDEWLKLMEHTVREADRLGLEMCMHNCAGWSSSGGPWITPAMSMQEVVWSETEVHGGSANAPSVEVKLDQPTARRDFYRDIAVIAFPKVSKFRLKDWEWKIDRNAPGRRPDSQIVRDARTAGDGDIIKLDRVVVLTDKMDRAGNLKWDAPAGDWTILRIGHTTTGRTNKPAPPEGMGLECDKLSRAAAKYHWDHSVARVLERAGPLAGKAFNNVLIDSYEVGFANWTDGFDKTFKDRFGYELTRYFPALTGRVVESVDTSERFLWDFRRLTADLMAENYFGYFAELCHANKLKLSIEPYGPGGFDDYQIAAIADVPMGEFWVNRPDAWHQWSAKLAASAAHARGLAVVGAESFTANPPASAFTDHPYAIKSLGDYYFAQGINRYIFHTNVHEPWGDDVLPGMTMGPHGIQFNRNSTWRKHARPWLDSVARTQFMLQQGTFVADLCYIAAEDAPQTPPNRSALNPVPPDGYDYDLLHYSFVKDMVVQNGEIVLPSGMSYRVLVLPDTDRMRPELLAKVVDLIKAGARVFVPRKIEASPSLQGGAESDHRVAMLAKTLTVPQISFADWLKGVEVTPDVGFEATPAATRIVTAHRRAGQADIYFVANQERDLADVRVTFRATGQPEIWNPQDGSVERPIDYEVTDDHRTIVKLRMEPAQSLFVAFRQKAVAPPVQFGATEVESNPPPHLRCSDNRWRFDAWVPGEFALITSSGKIIRGNVDPLSAPLELKGPWSLHFPPGWGAPDKLELPELISWPKHDNPDIQHFSGTALYTLHFDVPADRLGQGKPAVLDLGDVQVMAEVKLNGKDLGLLWKPPFRVDVSDALKTGTNALEVRVTNLWPNRLIGDAAYQLGKFKPTTRGSGITEIPSWLLKGEPKPQTERKTFATWDFYKKDDPLLPSGLIGPVKLQFGRMVEIPAPK